jgi:hypothetical protein
MAARKPIVLGDDGIPQALQAADTLVTGLRFETYTGTCNSSGVATITFSSAFKATPVVLTQSTWSGQQMVASGITASSATGCTVQGMISKGTLALSAGPFQAAPSGTIVTVVAIGA